MQPHNCAYLQMDSRRDIFRAIADPTRRAIILLLASGSMTPNALAEEFHSSRQAVSKHIQILTECRLVKQQQIGREIYYHINPKKIEEIDKWIARFKKIFETKFNQLDKILSTPGKHRDKKQKK